MEFLPQEDCVVKLFFFFFLRKPAAIALSYSTCLLIHVTFKPTIRFKSALYNTLKKRGGEIVNARSLPRSLSKEKRFKCLLNCQSLGLRYKPHQGLSVQPGEEKEDPWPVPSVFWLYPSAERQKETCTHSIVLLLSVVAAEMCATNIWV